MDQERFDQLTRALGTGTSRRRALKGLLGGALGGWLGVRESGNARAQDGSAQLGAACTNSNQCNQTGGPVVCGNNGDDRDGALNCCRNLGGACSINNHCCGSQLCNNGRCGGTTTSIPPGGACTASGQCSQPGGGTVICASNGISADGATNCCRNQGGTCDPNLSGADCCSPLLCVGGICGGTGTQPGSVALGGICSTTEQCNQTGGSVSCADNGLSNDGPLNCCRYQGGACAGDAQCCAGLLCTGGVCGGGSPSGSLPPGAVCAATTDCSQTGGATVCADNGIAGDGALNCCRNQGGACADGTGCCGALLCTNGVCGGTPAGGALPPGAICTVTSECSQTGGATVCASNGITGDGALNCCRNQGGTCADGTGCCGALLCTNGVCGGTPAGGALAPGAICTATSECSQSGGVTVCASNGISGDGALNCCRNQGGTCVDGTGCCDSLLCTNGVCGGTASGGLQPGAICSATSECSQVGGTTVCASNGISSDGDLNCCRNQGGACLDGTGCCGALLCTNGICGDTAAGGLPPGAVCSVTSQCSQVGGSTVCASNGITSDGVMNCCRYQGGTCIDGTGCCDALLCTNGVCSGTSGGSGTLQLGAICSATSECNQAGGAVVCASNGIATDGALNCCRNLGGVCVADVQCCSNLLCEDGVCGGVTNGGLGLGATCSATSQCSQIGGSVVCDNNGITSDGDFNCCRWNGGACSAGAHCCGSLLCLDGICQTG